MTLGGLAIAIGELVDDAVVDVENIFRRLRENREAGSPRSVFDVVVSASQEVRSGIVYATMIIILVFVPLFALSGIEGRLFAPLGQAYIISILASLVVSITLTPVLAYYLLPGLKRLDQNEGWLVRTLKRANRALLDGVFAHPRVVMTTAGLAVMIAIAALVALPRAFLPPFNEGTLTINTLFQPGISLAESHRVGLIAERLILEVPEVKSVARRTGRAELDEHAEGVHSSEIEVDLQARRPHEDRRHRRHPQPPVGIAGIDQRRPTDLASPRSHAVGRARADRAQDLRRRSRHLARARRGHAPEAGQRPRSGRSAGRTAGSHSAAGDHRRLSQGGSLRPAARADHRRAGAAVERAARIAAGRRQSPLRPRGPAVGSRAHHPGPRRVVDRDAVRLGAAQAGGGRARDRRPQPDPARERQAPDRRAGQCGRHPRYGRDHRRHPPRAGRGNAADRHLHQPGRHVPGAGRARCAPSDCCR